MQNVGIIKNIKHFLMQKKKRNTLKIPSVRQMFRVRVSRGGRFMMMKPNIKSDVCLIKHCSSVRHFFYSRTF